MRLMTGLLRIVATTLLVSTGGAAARADAIKNYDRVIDLGKPTGYQFPNSPKIDDDSNIVESLPSSRGDFTLGVVLDPSTPGRTLYKTLEKVGSHENILPEMLRNPSIIYEGINSSGHVIGQSHWDTDPPAIEGGFFFAPETNQFVQLKPLPGAVHLPYIFGINDLDQLVGVEDGKAIFYATPTSEPVELNSLLENAGGWKFYQATGINNRGEIVGSGSSPVMEYGITNFKLEPVATPEPTTLALFVAVAAGLVARSRLTRGRSPASRDPIRSRAASPAAWDASRSCD